MITDEHAKIASLSTTTCLLVLVITEPVRGHSNTSANVGIEAIRKNGGVPGKSLTLSPLPIACRDVVQVLQSARSSSVLHFDIPINKVILVRIIRILICQRLTCVTLIAKRRCQICWVSYSCAEQGVRGASELLVSMRWF